MFFFMFMFQKGSWPKSTFRKIYLIDEILSTTTNMTTIVYLRKLLITFRSVYFCYLSPNRFLIRLNLTVISRGLNILHIFFFIIDNFRIACHSTFSYYLYVSDLVKNKNITRRPYIVMIYTKILKAFKKLGVLVGCRF